MIVLANADKPVLLSQEIAYLQGCTCHLYQNDLIPDGTTLAGAFVESTFPTYAPQATTAWGPAYLNAANRGETDHPTLTWTFGGGGFQPIYGYYLTDSMGRLVLSERNPTAPFYINQARRIFTLQLRVQLDTLV